LYLPAQERIAELEAQALSEKEWTMRGEIEASRRPLNSALEVDMDFDTTGEEAGMVWLIVSVLAGIQFGLGPYSLLVVPARLVVVVSRQQVSRGIGFGNATATKTNNNC
jgi:cytochrome c-type biogenesis protein CcmH/NrfG